MRHLTQVHGSFSAHLLAARLRSEGIAVELHGALDGPYRLTMGDMARVDVLVPDDQLADAQLVLLADEIDATLDWPEPEESPVPASRRWLRGVAFALLLAAVTWSALRYAADW